MEFVKKFEWQNNFDEDTLYLIQSCSVSRHVSISRHYFSKSRYRRSKASVSAPRSLGKWACLGHISNPSVKTTIILAEKKNSCSYRTAALCVCQESKQMEFADVLC